MASSLSLLKLNVNNSSTQEKIVSILSERWPLTAKEIYNTLIREFGMEVSYQAVHKILTDLEENRVIEKSAKNYELSDQWIKRGKGFFTEIDKRYSDSFGKYEIDPNFEGTITLEFKDYSLFCVTIARIMASKALVGNGPNIVITLMKYGWWPFKFKFKDLELLATMTKNNPKAYAILTNDTPFGRWILKQYVRVGGIAAPIGTEIGLKEDMLIQGDSIAEIKFSDESLKIIKESYGELHGLDDLYRKFGLRKQPPEMHATVKITKNPALSELLRKQIIDRYFKGVIK